MTVTQLPCTTVTQAMQLLALNPRGSLSVPVLTARGKTHGAALPQDPLGYIRFMQGLKPVNPTELPAMASFVCTDTAERRVVQMDVSTAGRDLSAEFDVPSEAFLRAYEEGANLFVSASSSVALVRDFAFTQLSCLSFRRDSPGSVTSPVGFHGVEMTLSGACFARFVNSHTELKRRLGVDWEGIFTPLVFFHALNLLLPAGLELRWKDQRGHKHPLPFREAHGYWPLKDDPRTFRDESFEVYLAHNVFSHLANGKKRRRVLQINCSMDSAQGPELSISHFAQINRCGAASLYPGVTELFAFLLRQ